MRKKKEVSGLWTFSIGDCIFVLPGLQVFQILRENEWIVRDDVAQAGVLHSNVFQEQ